MFVFAVISDAKLGRAKTITIGNLSKRIILYNFYSTI